MTVGGTEERVLVVADLNSRGWSWVDFGRSKVTWGVGESVIKLKIEIGKSGERRFQSRAGSEGREEVGMV